MSLAAETTFDAAAPPAPLVERPRIAVHAALASGLLILLLTMGDRLLGDPDTQWHIAVGRWIVAHGAVPTTDLFSYTYAGAPWIAKEWVTQLLLSFAYGGAGWRGVVLLTSLAIAGTFVGLYAWLSARMRNTAALAMTFAAFLTCEPHMLARPHILVLPVIAAWMMVMVGALDRRRAPPAWAALLMVAWTNMHGSFPLGLVMAGVLAGEGVLLVARDRRLVALRRWTLFLALSTAATMLSPFGWRAILVPLMMFGNGGTLRFVSEWQPLAPDLLGLVAALMLAATLVVLALEVRANVFRILAAGLVAYLMIRHVRFVSLFGLISPILCARTAGMRLPALPLGRMTQVRATMLWVVIGAMISTDVVLAIALRPAPMPKMTPVAAYDAAVAHGIHGPVYNDYDFGGFLIAHDVKTFIDGRTDQLFLGDFMPDLTEAIDDKDDKAFAGIVARSGARWALIRPHSKTSAHFDVMPGWSRLYEDENAATYVRD